MKKILIGLILVFVLFPFYSVNANTFDATLFGTETASIGDKVEFTLEINTNIQVAKLTTSLKYDANVLELLSISPEESWKTTSTVGSNVLEFTNNGVTGKSTVVTIRFKVKTGSAKNLTTVSLDDLKVSTEIVNDSSVVLNHIETSKSVKLKSDDNTLSAIKINDKRISNFNSTDYSYKMEVESINESIKITSVLNDSNATYVDEFGDRSVDLEYGENIVLLKTKSESGREQVYTLTIIRKDDRLVDNDLKSIILDGGKVKIDFDKSILNYNVKTYKLEDIEIEVETSDKEATYKIDAPKKLVIGTNIIKIEVTAVTKDVKTYTINVINSDVPTNTRLKTLAIKGISIDFNSDKYNYEIKYDKSYTKGLTIYKTTISNDTTVKVTNNEDLKPDDVITITVNAIDGSGSSVYKIKLVKDTRINFFCILEVIALLILIVLVTIQLVKKNKLKAKQKMSKLEKELETTKEIKL